jgi:hypothetical protein
MSASSSKASRDVVDLSGDDVCLANSVSKNIISANDDDDDGLLEVWGGATPLTQLVRRKKRKQSPSVAPAPDAVDAIDMTSGSSPKAQTFEEQRFAAYKQNLGPHRMEFLSDTDGEEFLKSHTFAKTINNNDKYKKTSRVQLIKIRKLHRELVQYALDLPATPQGSIFVRVDESRLDLVRALITGKALRSMA